ncbi:hypothetical protein LSTR_LSTR007292 [Laodelphax striatellus]|uniref:Uncharacterized protein n=1 Tax=Laodelphax striatellus TaxID=195883 RepID=A0A482XEN5_LAOST|nr:hypothetical protein LSTR_LSTR007292 [Laodelphax striatellus]
MVLRNLLCGRGREGIRKKLLSHWPNAAEPNFIKQMDWQAEWGGDNMVVGKKEEERNVERRRGRKEDKAEGKKTIEKWMKEEKEDENGKIQRRGEGEKEG